MARLFRLVLCSITCEEQAKSSDLFIDKLTYPWIFNYVSADISLRNRKYLTKYPRIFYFFIY